VRPSIPSLIRRWRESHADGMQLWREMRGLGSPHAARTVSRFIPALRRAAAAGHAPDAQSSPSTRPQGPFARAVSFVLVCSAAQRSEDASLSVAQRCQGETRGAQANTLYG
jgi:hypothetical protein